MGHALQLFGHSPCSVPHLNLQIDGKSAYQIVVRRMHRGDTCSNIRTLHWHCSASTQANMQGHPTVVRGTTGSLRSPLENVIVKLTGRRDVLATNTRRAAGGWRRAGPLCLSLSSQQYTEQAEDGPQQHAGPHIYHAAFVAL